MARTLTPNQELAAHSTDKPTAVIAAAGSGKTTVLVERYLSHLEQGLSPENILTVTFTTEAAAEMKERILARCEDLPFSTPESTEAIEHSREIGTIHSFCFRVLNQFGSTVGLEPIREILTPFQLADTLEATYRKWLADLPPENLAFFLKYYSHRELRDLFRQVYRNRFHLRAKLSDLSRLGETDRHLFEMIQEWLLPSVDSIEKSLVAAGTYSFDELEEYTLKILSQSSTACEHLRSQYQAFLIDEFQDTSPNQWKILQTLLPANWNGLFVVGDPKQSIYRFRNAAVRLFQHAAQGIQEKKGHVIDLATNFRSDPGLLTQINEFSRRLFEGAEVAHQEMKSPNAEGVPTLEKFEYTGDARTEANAQEVALVTQELDKVLANHPEDSVALLFRMADRMQSFEQAISVPVKSQAQQSVFQSYEVWGIIHYLKFVLDPLDDYELASFLRSPFMNFSHQELWKLRKRTPEGKLAPILNELVNSRATWLMNLIEKGEMRVAQLTQALFRHCAAQPSQTGPVAVFLEALEKGPTKLAEAVRAIENWERENISAPDIGSIKEAQVRLMTIHASKGLEFDHVFLVDLLRKNPTRLPFIKIPTHGPPGIRYRQGVEFTSSGAFEAAKKMDVRGDYEETKRILYVAMTRAKKSLRLFLPSNPKLVKKGTWADLIRSTEDKEVPFEGSPS